MASSSSIQKSFKYDVFLSFRGEDTRKGFVDHLHHALLQKGIITYKDDEKIQKGEMINEQLIRSIEDSRFYIIVFSKNYASSSWCLDELVNIMECQKMAEHTAYPVFYDVEPTQVRHQSGAVEEAFAKHVEKEAAGRWRDALKEAANLAGWELKNTVDGGEANFIKLIVECISLELRFISPSFDENLVGIESRVNRIVASFKDGLDDCFIGIKGIGGGGKTTLARAVFDHISHLFEGKSFVKDVRDISKLSSSSSGLEKLQKQVLKDVLHDKSIEETRVSEREMKRMYSTKVLLVLDDVDHVDQLKVLAGSPERFRRGSKIIITTRDEQVLKAHRVHARNVHDIDQLLLSEEEAICLFSKCAFGREIPIQGYEKLSRKVVDYAAGLPLTIKVLGSFLCSKNEGEWKDTIKRLQEIPEKETLMRLEISYDGLEHDQKEIFLDVACMLKGEMKDEAIKILENCGFNAKISLRVLEQKSLLTISNDGRLGLHDRIEEMGRNIVRRLHPGQPHKHSRLWIKEEIENILKDDKGTKATRCIKLEDSHLHPDIIMEGLRKMSELRLLYVDGKYQKWKINEVYGRYLPNALRSLHWHGYPFSCLPKAFQANNLVNLEMPHSSIFQLWEEGERKVLNKLKFLDLRISSIRTLDLGPTPNLERLDLRSCYYFVELNMPVECPELKYLNLRYSKVSRLDLGSTPNLERLDLSWCRDFVEFKMPLECPELKYVNLSYSKVSRLDLGSTPNLERLDLSGCRDLAEFKMPLECPELKYLNLRYSKVSRLDLGSTPNLERLDLSWCRDLAEFKMPLECPELKYLNLRYSKVSRLDLGSTPNLERLDLSWCRDLAEFKMPLECPELKYLNLSYSKVSRLDLGSTPNLERLDLRGCYDFVELNMPVECPNLKYIELSGSILSNINLKMTPYLEELRLDNCNNFVELHIPIECSQLKCLYLSGSKLTNLSLGLTPHLVRLDLSRCLKLKFLDLSGSDVSRNLGLAQHLKSLESLEELTLSIEDIKQLPDGICFLKNLKSLKLESCFLLEQLPEDLDKLQCLEKLQLSDCMSLLDIPDSICRMNCLKYLHLPYCNLVTRLPEELGDLKSLKELNIVGTAIEDLPLSIFDLKDLCIVWSRGRLEKLGFTSLKKLTKYIASSYVSSRS